MKTTTKKQIERIADELAKNLGSGVHVYAHDLLEAVEVKFTKLTARQIDMVCDVANTVRRDALRKIWG